MACYAQGGALVELGADVLLVGRVYDLSRAVEDAHIHDALCPADCFHSLLDKRAMRRQHGVSSAVLDEVDKGIPVFDRTVDEFLFLIFEKKQPEEHAPGDHERADGKNEFPGQ